MSDKVIRVCFKFATWLVLFFMVTLVQLGMRGMFDTVIYINGADFIFTAALAWFIMRELWAWNDKEGNDVD